MNPTEGVKNMIRNDLAPLSATKVKRASKLLELVSILASCLTGLSLGPVLLALMMKPGDHQDPNSSTLLFMGLALFGMGIAIIVITVRVQWIFIGDDKKAGNPSQATARPERAKGV